MLAITSHHILLPLPRNVDLLHDFLTEQSKSEPRSPWAVGSLGPKGKALLGCKSDCQETATEATSHRSHLEATKSKLNFRITKAEQNKKNASRYNKPYKRQNPKKTSPPQKPAHINNSQTVKKTKQGTTHFPRLPKMEGKDNNNKVKSHPNKLPIPRKNNSLPPNLLKRATAVMFPAKKLSRKN